ncbi:RICIN domain-containing protein [Actinacidiphila bryophytorum]|uniref:Cytolethal distending toxin A/C domain-containing protein n=1 Tax=Actinacidiphila bryophytorum TaxID=1436133 RepID=A0A9W4E286_9ACTN|nr:RICIN domain-containing protein [Actinacidiphila bryophytorum]MBM9439021.1 RICIN domain-containing protein [Actinacidiphila bryophytorum]MBN6545902.1 RICIN domain-containing protein [Actinacidiphila bryophytorum]CAG7597500.1 putative Cytolethal distending toxin A/C domain-containing protein [Actinacidiphila bryophytorum]
MKLRTLTQRSTTASLGIAAAVATTILVAPQAQAAPTYWQFKSAATGTCLSAGTTGVTFASTCTGATNQQWDFVTNDPSGYNELKNRLTGQCLDTYNGSSVNGTTMDPCTWKGGQRWHFDYTTGSFTSALTWGGVNLKLRAEGTRIFAGQEPAAWDGWHN